MQLQLKLHREMVSIQCGDLEKMLHTKGFDLVCGIDEVGRGPLAGPVVAAAVVLPGGVKIPGLADSKKLLASERERLFAQMVALDIPMSIGIIDHRGIDTMNILRASMMAMRKAVAGLKLPPEIILVDGNQQIPKMTIPQITVIGGDGKCDCIAAASIIAKVTRDRIMTDYERLFPRFSFSCHKGYSTPGHLSELREHGPCEIHRRSFRPVAEALLKNPVLL
jgi:ribonuclease HII